MKQVERRNFMPLDEVQEYCQALEASQDKPTLYKLTSALTTVDRAVELSPEMLHQSPKLTLEAWSAIRDSLFNCLIRSCPGYFVVLSDQNQAIEPGSKWPLNGRLEFYPQSGRRKADSYHGWLSRIDPEIVTVLRWCLAEGRQVVNRSDFTALISGDDEKNEDDEEKAAYLMERMYELCRQEATKGKKRAHQKWWQLYWEADSCHDKKQQHALRKRMLQLQSVWGKPS